MYTNIRLKVIGSVWFLCAFSLLFFQSCASTSARHRWIGEGLDAQNAQSQGSYEKADQKYKDLLKAAPDNTNRRWIAYKRAELAKEQGKMDDARERARAIDAEKINDEYGAKALFLWAQIDEEPELYWKTLSTYPDSYAAEKALKYLTHEATTTEKQLTFVNRLREEATKNKDSSLVDNLYLAEARTLHTLGRENEALAVYRTLFLWDEEGALADDALWEIAAIYREVQQWEDALEAYELFQDRIESSWFVGAYTPHLVDDSVFLSGQISLLFLSDYRRAIRYFERYLDLFPEGPYADDSMFLISEAYRLKGDQEAQRTTLDAFQSRFPDSRYVRRLKND